MGRGKRKKTHHYCATQSNASPIAQGAFVGPRQPNEREQQLYPRLLAHGGARIVVPVDGEDLDLELIFARGQLFDGRDAIQRRGEPRSCHANAARLWERGQNVKTGQARACALATGYALSDDGLWRSHSFCVAVSGRVLETTTSRSLYFGVRLDDVEAAAFFRREIGG